MRSLVPLVLAALVGCPKREDTVAESAVPELLRIADRQWADRGGLGLEVVEGTLTEAYRIEPVNPEVLWRLVRLNVARGLAEPDPRASQYAFAEARALGMACLEIDGTFVQRRAELGWADAALLLDEGDASCLAWTSLAWARWLDAHGAAAAALDLEPLDALLDRAVAVSSGDARETAVWADGILAGNRPPWEGGDPARAAELLTRAIQAAPDELWRRVDYIRLVAEPTGSTDLGRQHADAILASNAATPENATAKAFASAWLAEVR